jgi:hypothetical protein
MYQSASSIEPPLRKNTVQINEWPIHTSELTFHIFNAQTCCEESVKHVLDVFAVPYVRNAVERRMAEWVEWTTHVAIGELLAKHAVIDNSIAGKRVVPGSCRRGSQSGWTSCVFHGCDWLPAWELSLVGVHLCICAFVQLCSRR